jgi:hypothetical protein
MQYGLVLINLAVSKAPVIMHNIVLNGPLGEMEEWTRQYHKLDNVTTARNRGTYLGVPRWM